MSWATRRKILYVSGIALFFAIVFGGPLAYKLLTVPPTCHDGIQNQGETTVDRGGPCLLLDARSLQPATVLWARAFPVRGGAYNAVAYVENPNKDAGVESISYHFSFYDSDNILVAERSGSSYVMPGGITPLFESGINAGNRIIAHTYFSFTEAPRWERMSNAAADIAVSGKDLQSVDVAPRLGAIAQNDAVADASDVGFVATIFDTSGNAINTSSTKIRAFSGGSQEPIVFTWPNPFSSAVGSIDILPTKAPTPDPRAQR